MLHAWTNESLIASSSKPLRKASTVWTVTCADIRVLCEFRQFIPLRIFSITYPVGTRDRVGGLARSVSDEAQWVEVFHKWMPAMVAQWSGKNRMRDNCLIPALVNFRQELKKSAFCRSLLPPVLQGYYTDDFDVTREGDALRKIRDLELINIDEFNRMGEAKLGRFGEHWALMGVKKVVTHFGYQYLLNQF